MFTPKAQEEAHKQMTEKHTDHGGEDHDAEAHEKHDEDEEDEEPPYEAQVVEIVSYVGEYVAIKGLKAGEAYVSTGVYFVKSMLLKSSLGEHGH